MGAKAGEKASFSRIVVGKAIENTKRAFDSIIGDITIAIISLLFGFGVYWHFNGLPVAMEQAASVVAFTLAPLCFVVIVVFLWNLWLAPCELAYEAIRLPPDSTSAQKKINWAVWKERTQYTTREFAAILAKDAPTDAIISSEAESFLQLILEEARSKKLSYIPRIVDFMGDNFLVEADQFTFVEKSIALSWAEHKHFDVAHVR